MTGKILVLALALLASGCGSAGNSAPPPNRESLIPAGQAKVLPEMDAHPPRSVTDEYAQPVPLPYPVNTAGVEDSAFIMPDGKTLYLWFTPDVSKTPQETLTDGVTGIYVLHQNDDGTWGAAQRVWLQDPGKLALDGCEFVLNETMWFCTAREGYDGIHWFTAQWDGSQWGNWQLADFNPDYEVGELHITADGQELYFHSARADGHGGYDIWVSQKVNGEWGEPVNLSVVNTAATEGWPFVTADGQELWFTRGFGAPELWRSKRVNGEWGEPQQMFTSFAGEASLDSAGNVYFTHHFLSDDQMLEADIYFAARISP